ncbi:MAG: NAD-dependent epimerase/dehydratase family protein [Bacteriovoracaceae bacterium]
MKILVTGAGGFLGFEIAKMLREEGHEVVNFSRQHHSKLDALQIKTHIGDLRSVADLENVLKDIEVIFHVAALAGVWGMKEDFFDINYQGTKNLVNLAIKLKVKKLIYTSTPSVVFGDKPLLGVNETTPYPDTYFTHYAHSKSLAERYVLSHNGSGLLTCALRPHLIWGPLDPHIIPRLVERALKGRLKVVGDGTNLVDVIHVKNAAHAHLLAFHKLEENSPVAGSAYFIGQEEPVNLWDFINKILVQKKVKPIKRKVSFKVAYLLGATLEKVYERLKLYHKEPMMTRFVAMQLAHSHYFSQEKAKIELGYNPLISTEEGLKTL